MSADRARLVRLLTNTNLHLHHCSGDLRCAVYANVQEAAPRAPISDKEYIFDLSPERESIRVVNHDGQGGHRGLVFCRNDRYYFALGSMGDLWMVRDIQRVDPLPPQATFRFAAFRAHFDYPHVIGERRLEQLLRDEKHSTTVAEVGVGRYRVVGRRAPSAADPLLTFRADVVVSADGRFAYMVSYESTERRGEADGTTTWSVTCDVDEAGSFPVMRTCTEKVTVGAGNPKEQYEFKRSFNMTIRPDGQAVDAFYLPHFGLPEPDLKSHAMSPGVPNHLALFLTFVAGLVLIATGRRIRRMGVLPASEERDRDKRI